MIESRKFALPAATMHSYSSTQESFSKKWWRWCKQHIHDSQNFKSLWNLDINTKNVESLSIEFISKNSKNAVPSTISRPPDGDFKAFNPFL